MGLHIARGGRDRAEPRGGDRADAKTEQMPAVELQMAPGLAQERLPILAALSASYHHSDGRPEMPYFGNGSAWLKRSQRA